MTKQSRLLDLLAVAFVLFSLGAKAARPMDLGLQSPADLASSSQSSAALRDIVASGKLSDLRWPDFSDYRIHLKNFYEPAGYALVWLRNNRPTQQAQAIIQVLQQADSIGLNAEDYDGPRWPERLARLRQSASQEYQAQFDAALTVSVMRYISDLHIGRVNPVRLKFNLEAGPKKYDLPLLLREKLVNGADIRAELDRVEPPFAGYKRTKEAFQRYLELSRKDDGEQLPVPPRPIKPGEPYSGIPRLRRILALLGDRPPEAAPPQDPNLYDKTLSAAVKRFQDRHGLTPNGRLDPQTVQHLNVPLSFRLKQLRLVLERWRWLPYQFTQPPIVVNIPQFRLVAFDENEKLAFTSNVIVGRAFRTQTPVFEKDMKFVVFRPYWHVPRDIQRSEVVPSIRKNRDYVTKKGYEVVTAKGEVVTSGTIDDEVLQQLSTGNLEVRQKPGSANALGLVKLMFPNEYDVYLHSTPALELFSQSRRDFSHGCIRVEKAAELAAWVLRDKPEWSLERVRAAMQSGQDNFQVNLSKPIPVLIIYGTAVVDEQNVVRFFDDIYGHDVALEKALANGYPYPW